MNLAVNQELIIRLSIFLCVLLLMLCWEKVLPRRRQDKPRWPRRFVNLLLLVLNTGFVRIVLPLAAVSAAAIANMHAWGLFNNVSVNTWLAGILCFLCLDLLIYFQHRLMHRVPLLWRVHRVHHSDTRFDVTTGVRFHPIEMLLSMLIKILAVLLLGPPVLAVVVFEVVLSSSSLFNHGNVLIPVWLDHYLRLLVVTPDMHRVHHSVLDQETNSNYGFNIPWWDRLFATYRAQPQAGHSKINIGLKEFRGEDFVNLLWLLKQPFLNAANYIGDGRN